MAAGTRKAASVPYRPEKEKIVDFAPERLRAPFFLRCAALAIDYMILIVFPVAWLLLSKLLGDSSDVSIAGISWFSGIALSILNFLVLPLWKGQTAGKMAAGITILKMDGTRIDARTLLLRNLLGYGLTLLTFGLGFLLSAVNNSGRALHDFVGGTVVVRARKSPVL